MKLKELISSPDKWCKGILARDEEDNSVDPNDPLAVSWCLMGGIKKCYADSTSYHRQQLWGKLHTTLWEIGGGNHSPFSFNDDGNTTFEQIKELLDKADI